MRGRTGTWEGRGAAPVWVALAVVALLALCAGGAGGQDGPPPPLAPLPFAVGERFEYAVRIGSLGTIGKGAMWIEGPVDIRGTDAYVLRFDVRAGVGFIKGTDRTESWLDSDRMASLRFVKRENHLLSRHSEAVEMYPAEQRWTAADGRTGQSPTDAPLDELSFMYYIRTLPLDSGTTLQVDRHFEAARNPTSLAVVGHETITTPAGEFRTIIVEMRVRDPRRYRGDGVIRINLTDDPCRLPVRIESRMPVVGTSVLTLEAYTHNGEHRAAHAAQTSGPARH